MAHRRADVHLPQLFHLLLVLDADFAHRTGDWRWFALPAVVGLALPQDLRWSAWRIMIESQMIALVLIPIAVFRVLGTKVVVGTQTLSNPQPDNPMTWLFVGGLVPFLIGGTALYFSMELQRRRSVA